MILIVFASVTLYLWRRKILKIKSNLQVGVIGLSEINR